MILIDANVLIALVQPHDELKDFAYADWRRLIGNSFYVTESVLAETAFRLPGPAGRGRLERFLDLAGAKVPPEPDSPEMRRSIFAWLGRYSEHTPDWADAQLAVLCGMNASYQVWTYDLEFRTLWRRPDGTRIPIVGRDLRR